MRRLSLLSGSGKGVVPLRDRLSGELRAAVGPWKLVLDVDAITVGPAPNDVVVELVMFAPKPLADRLRAAPAFQRAVDQLRGATASSHPELSTLWTLAVLQDGATPESLALALTLAGAASLADELALTPPSGDHEEQRLGLRLQQIADRGIRRMRVMRGRIPALSSELL